MKNLFPLIKKEIRIEINGVSVSRGNQLLFKNLTSDIIWCANSSAAPAVKRILLIPNLIKIVSSPTPL